MNESNHSIFSYKSHAVKEYDSFNSAFFKNMSWFLEKNHKHYFITWRFFNIFTVNLTDYQV